MATWSLCGLAMELHLNRRNRNRNFTFQPAEENGTGADKVLNDPKFTLKPHFAFALHNIPGYRKIKLSLANTFSCAVNSLIIKLKGVTSHAAEPHWESILLWL
jgi:metal-dependent amidase/aminoacylase/carboxypeptidase family protein